MAELVKRGTFQKPIVSGAQAITGIGFQPKGIVFYGVNRTALDAYDIRSVWCYSFTDGITSVALSGWSEDNEATAVQRRWWQEGFVHTIRYPGGGSETATLTSLDADGFTLNWTVAPVGPASSQIHYLAIGGDAEVAVGKFESGTVDAAEVAVTGLGFEPAALMCASVWFTGTSDETGPVSGRNNIPAIGFTDGVNQALSWIASGETSPADTRRYQRTNRCFGIGSSTAAAVSMEGEIVSFDADGFTVRVTDAAATSLNTYYLAIGGVTAFVGAFNQPTVAGSQTISGLGFQPGALFLMSVAAAASSSVQTQSRFALGATDGLSQGSSWTGDEHNVTPTRNARYTTASAILRMADPAADHLASTLLARAEFAGFNDDGFELDWTDVDATARQVVFLAFLGAPADVPDVETRAAISIRSTAATIRGRIDPNLSTMTGWLIWSDDPDALTNETVHESIGSGSAFVNYSSNLSGLTPETTYYFRAVGNNGLTDFYGEILSFTTSGEQTFVDGEVSHPLTYLEVTTRDEETTAFAEVDLNDDPDYHFGYKAPWVIEFLSIARGLSDRVGQIRHLEFGALFTDTMRYWRGLLEDEVNRYLTNRPLAEWFIDDEDRRIEGSPRLAAAGYVHNYTTLPGFQFELNGADWLKKKFSRKRNAQQSWQPLITTEDFTDCPEDRIDTAAPLIYGSLGLTGADPVENVAITINAQPTAAPGSFALSLQAGGRFSGVRRYYKVSQVVGGLESEQSATLTTVTTDTNKTIRSTWTPDGSATAVYLYSSDKPDFSQFLITVLSGAATSYDDDTTPPNQDAKWLTGTDWLLGLRINLTYYVYAKLAGGLYSRPGIAKTNIMPAPVRGKLPEDRTGPLRERDIDITWAAHPDEVDGYRIVREHSFYSNWNPAFDRQMDVGTGITTTTDDVVTTSDVDLPDGELVALSAAGQVIAIPVGSMSAGDPTPQLVNTLLVCRQASARVGNIYLPVTVQNVNGEDETTYEPIAESEYGVTWFAPDHAGWIYPDKYVDINGRRYTLIFTTVSPLPEKVLVDVDGVEEDGDGDGALIRSIVDQRLHFINNWIAPDTPYQSGTYLTAADTVFPHLPTLPLVDEDSHAEVKATLADRIGGDYEGAGIIGADGEFVTATDALGWFHVCGDLDQTFKRTGQDSISCEPHLPAVAPDRITDVRSIRDGSLSISDEVQSAFFNLLPYVHTRDYTGRTRNGWYGVGEERSQASIDNYEQERESPRFELHMLRGNTAQGAATIADVMSRKLQRYKHPRRVGTMEVPFSGLNYEPGEVALIDAVEGIGAAGWVGREVRFTAHDVRPSQGIVKLEFYDLEFVFDDYLVSTPDHAVALQSPDGQLLIASGA